LTNNNSPKKTDKDYQSATSLLLTVVGLGCYATASQVIFIREFFTIFTGNELCLGIVFSCWFLGIIIGSGLGSRLFGLYILLATCVLWIIVSYGLLTSLRLWRSIIDLPAGEFGGLGTIFLSALALITPHSLFIGFLFPVACQAWKSEAKGTVIGRVYVLESGGAILGGILVSVLLVGLIPPLVSLAISVLLLLIGLIWANFAFRLSLYLKIPTLLLALSIIGSISSGLLTRFDESLSTKRFAQLETGLEKIASIDTPYQHLDLGRLENQFSIYADGKISGSFPDPYSWRSRTHLSLCQHPKPKKVLVLGFGSYEFLPVALLHPIEQIDLVELDPLLLKLVDKHLSSDSKKALTNEKVNLHLTDGRRFLGQTDQRWDLIFSDAPDPTTAAKNRFFTQEYFRSAARHLAEGGVFGLRISSSTTFLGPDSATVIRIIKTTLAQEFRHIQLVPGQETFLFATNNDNVLATNAEALAERYQTRTIQDPHFSKYHFRTIFQTGLPEDVLAQLEYRGQEQINLDRHPVTYLHSILRWSQMATTQGTSFFRVLASTPSWGWYLLAALIGIIFISRLLFRKATVDQLLFSGAISSITTIGLLGMALELIMILAYQSLFGSLYGELGLLITAFMLGLVCGGFFTIRFLNSITATNKHLAYGLMIQALLCLLLPIVISASSADLWPISISQVLFFLLIFLAGLGPGIVFPLAGQISLSGGKQLSQSAGWLNAADHVGAAIGSFMAGTIWLPTQGLTFTCLLLAIIAGLTGLYNFLLVRKIKH
jgi:spermidine synthase